MSFSYTLDRLLDFLVGCQAQHGHDVLNLLENYAVLLYPIFWISTLKFAPFFLTSHYFWSSYCDHPHFLQTNLSCLIHLFSHMGSPFKYVTFHSSLDLSPSFKNFFGWKVANYFHENYQKHFI